MTSRRVRLLLACLHVGGAVAASLGIAQSPPAQRVQVGISRSADSVTVGDPFRIVVRVRAPLGSVVEFPQGPDTTGPVQPLDPPAIATRRDPAALDQSVTYRVAAWDVDTLAVPIGELVVRTPAGVERFALAAETIHVRSVLPADSAQRVPKPVRPVFPVATGAAWWWWLVVAAVALALIGLWWWWRRRRAAPHVAPEDAFARAQEEFARIDRLRLLEAGERGRYVSLVVDVLRTYLQARHPEARLSHTSTELLLALHGKAPVPSDRLGALLAEADLVKFARRGVTPDRATQLGGESRGIVEYVEAAVRRAIAAEDAARVAAEKRSEAAA